MSQNRMQEATLFASHHNHVEKRPHMVGIVFSSLLAVVGACCFFVTTQLSETSSTLGMTLMLLGTTLLLTAIFRFFWKSQRMIYVPTGSTISARSFYFDTSFLERLTQAVSQGQLHSDPVLRSSVNGSLRLDVLIAEDGSFGAIQLFQYISYTYKPQTPIVYLSGEEAKEAKRFIATL